jgi:aspartyl-tRNA(Asn)/glutamyl-tRNA(Gln) amidotransferase subunit A
LNSTVADAFRDARDAVHGRALPDPSAAPPLRVDLPSAQRALRPPEFALRPPGANGSGPAAGAREGVEAALAAAAADRCGAVVWLDAGGARAAADRLDQGAAEGAVRGPLHGMAITVKDIIDVAGMPTRAGSKGFERWPQVDAPAVARLRAAGAVVLGKATTHEFALGVTTPACRNPFDHDRIAGGSSGGSAVAVATGIGTGSLGTDTRASLRVPASLCGVVGFKPTFGRVPTGGVVPLSWTVDHVGPIAGTVHDAAAMLAVLVGGRIAVGGDAAAGRVDGLVIGVIVAAMGAADTEVSAAVMKRLAVLERLGATLIDVAFPDEEALQLANGAGLLITRAEAATFHRAAGTDVSACLPEVAEQLRAGAEISACDYLDAQRQRASLTARLLDTLAPFPLLASPTTPVTAPPRTEYERYLVRLSENTMLWSLAGGPALSMPAGFDGAGMPVGLQLSAAPGDDALVAAAGIALEQAGQSSGWA